MNIRCFDRADSIRPVFFERRLCLAIAGSLALHLVLLALLSGPGHFGGGHPFTTVDIAGSSQAAQRLTGRLLTRQRASRPAEPVVIEWPASIDSVVPPPESRPAPPPIPDVTTDNRRPLVESPAHVEPVQPHAPPKPPPPTSPASTESHTASPSQDVAEAAARRAGYLPTSLLDSKAGLLSEIVIEYPESAGGQSGRVALQLFIDEYGIVREVLVSQAIPPGFFEQAAVTAFSGARFSPALRNGRPVKSQMMVEVDFSVFNRPTPISGRTEY